ncbi:hypothetical protein IQ249_10055 [Lusitaniella coriacea LEGE 07157]|uniref:Fluorescence recovery protein n=1 Tax=Lusitaniella coriacea LEGE 07157 TaxID=945747 RepID=A0A8J7DWR9_9CYAN|nr:hypothetical protein [Lusitaniella coriacea]MBE9116238.1 hypothetical protein [Lusitaniella coriacea LEGE 07157]
MNESETQWSKTEKNIARQAFDKAHQLEIEKLIEEVKERARNISKVEDMWKLHDFLSAKRYDIDGKYDDRDSSLIFVFAQLVREKLLSMDELDGLAPEKRAKIVALSRM